VPTPDVTKPPQELEQGLRELRVALAGAVPRKRPDRNLLIGTWNIRAFGDVTEKWVSDEGDSPVRNMFDVACIAEIVSSFDIVAIQEVRANLRGLRHVLKALGRNWGVLMTDVTKGKDGNNERMAFVYDTARIRPSGLACELVEPPDDGSVPTGAFKRQFARTPYAVSFASATTTVILVTLHVVYGSDLGERAAELRAIAEWLSGWAEQEEEWRHNLIAVGDFNIDRAGDALYDAFTSTGLTPAPALNDVRRTIFDSPTRASFYDQIAWFTDGSKGPLLTLQASSAGNFDFVPNLAQGRSKTDLSWHISDHYPMYAEFALPQPR
jgi:endonuclease/exonuclease/phosphatase family metal-dependent hydrolase